ncbi:MarR family transcriptional regulator [Sphingomonas sp.]|uniref:MarR family winged helix-turn-helix transcriptional regulator n=1 Tax=Sphingomonas sp. TaxID=28214 RepID=UPI001B214DC8|nr:MarR family transcriptional regulator [Sphingomonas sp.]MBO9711705.1 MarR family transcriptional regulator [Sphingomonas sp.]
MRGELGGIDEVVGFHLRLAHGAVLRHFSEHFAELGLTQKQVSVLWLTADNPGIAQTDLAVRLQMDRATTMAIVHAIEAKGLIERRPSATDRRRVAWFATDQGSAALARAKLAIGRHEDWLKSRFTEAELAALLSFLKRIHG